MSRFMETSLNALVKIRIRFWGVRGSFVTSDVRIGNHTSCISIEYGDQLIIIDTGSGVIDVAQYIIREYISKGKEIHITILYSHLHKDHRDGITSFYPIFFPNVHINFIGGMHESMMDGATFLENVEQNLIREVFVPPSFPVEYKFLASKRTFQTVKPGEWFTIPCAFGDIRVLMLEMNHPQRAFGFRLEIGERVIADCMDHEDAPGTEFNKNIITLSDGADVKITDAQYTDDRYFGRMFPGQKPCIGYGHMHVTALAKHLKEAQPKLCVTTHHEPMADFDEVLAISERVQELSGVKTIFAAQGNEIVL